MGSIHARLTPSLPPGPADHNIFRQTPIMQLPKSEIIGYWPPYSESHELSPEVCV